MSCRVQASPRVPCRILDCSAQLVPHVEAFALHFTFAHVWSVPEPIVAELLRMFVDPDCPTFTLYEAIETARSLARP